MVMQSLISLVTPVPCGQDDAMNASDAKDDDFASMMITSMLLWLILMLMVIALVVMILIQIMK